MSEPTREDVEKYLKSITENSSEVPSCYFDLVTGEIVEL